MIIGLYTKKGEEMVKKNKFLGVIPARGGSKGVKRKNIRLLNGKPLIYYTIREALKSKLIDELVVSTEDKEIRRVAESYGVKVINRPKSLATDTATSPDVLIHAVNTLKKEGEEFDNVIMLQCTTPFRTCDDIDESIEAFINSDCDSLVSISEAPAHCNPHWVRRVENNLVKPYLDVDKSNPHPLRQELPKVYWRNGMIYIVKTSVLLKTRNLYGDKCKAFIMPPGNRVNIDEEIDFKLAELLMQESGEDYYEKLSCPKCHFKFNKWRNEESRLKQSH